ncbi:hypothetical protein QBC34DRAFT_389904 [Podospora aff. communis PSN243]|uniref:F-box domain-containing protein n=1 Tax=Podospora aff. communis PSN243 TaxID=3040156 RepID=A0AAV9H671_9PEZI|nr:hypothetical protein QBC34DRAFT_389904 [Podospora aff. communis PSN243]
MGQSSHFSPQHLRLTIRRRPQRNRSISEKPAMKPTSALHLPPELGEMVLGHIPISFFQEDLARLTICKRWYDLVYPVFLRRLEYTPRVISRLVNRKATDRKIAAINRARERLRESTRYLTLVIDGKPATQCFDTPYNLLRFGDMLQDSPKLKFVRFLSRPANERWKADPYSERELPLHGIGCFTERLRFLTDLDLDLCGGARVPGVLGSHFCHTISPFIYRLRSLSLRTRCLCKDAFKICPGKEVTLQHLTVNLHLGTISKVNPKLNSTTLCPPRSLSSSARSWEFHSPMDELRPAVQAVAKEMRNPERARIVHKALNGEIHIWDAKSNECVVDEVEEGGAFAEFLELEAGRCAAEEDWPQVSNHEQAQA